MLAFTMTISVNICSQDAGATLNSYVAPIPAFDPAPKWAEVQAATAVSFLGIEGRDMTSKLTLAKRT